MVLLRVIVLYVLYCIVCNQLWLMHGARTAGVASPLGGARSHDITDNITQSLVRCRVGGFDRCDLIFNCFHHTIKPKTAFTYTSLHIRYKHLSRTKDKKLVNAYID